MSQKKSKRKRAWEKKRNNLIKPKKLSVREREADQKMQHAIWKILTKFVLQTSTRVKRLTSKVMEKPPWGSELQFPNQEGRIEPARTSRSAFMGKQERKG